MGSLGPQFRYKLSIIASPWRCPAAAFRNPSFAFRNPRFRLRHPSFFSPPKFRLCARRERMVRTQICIAHVVDVQPVMFRLPLAAPFHTPAAATRRTRAAVGRDDDPHRVGSSHMFDARSYMFVRSCTWFAYHGPGVAMGGDPRQTAACHGQTSVCMYINLYCAPQQHVSSGLPCSSVQ